MKIEGVVINDAKAKKYFAFIRQFPGVCAQGDTIEETEAKVNKYFRSFIDRMENEEIKFNLSETF
jgi:predicted RNase H-like HicB family nuclease